MEGGMSDYKPPFGISNHMLELVASISEKVGQINCHKELESKPHLRKNNRIKSIHSSLKIEAKNLVLNPEKHLEKII
jgi:Fic family protein